MNSTQINSPARRAAFLDFLAQYLRTNSFDLIPMVGDASFRYYYRISQFQGFIAVDAAPDLANDNQGFVTVATLLKNHQLHAPEVYAHDLAQGFLLISDLGDNVYLQALSGETADPLYASALDALERLQTIKAEVAPFGAQMMQQELTHFNVWLLQDYVQCQLDAAWAKKLEKIFAQLVDFAVKQPQVFMHRDYHSRNLLVCEQQTPGILDFQDAMIGPVTYDAVSLLRDAYVAWPDSQVSAWANSFYERISDRADMRGVSRDYFIHAFDFMGMQRHLKAVFIFTRKFLRDNVAGYLGDIPRTLDYVIKVSERYPEMKDLHALLTERVLPKLDAAGKIK